MRAWCLSAVALVALAAPATARAQTVELSRQDVVDELASTYRILGDEDFLAGETDDATAHYQTALDYAAQLRPEEGEISQPEVDLARAELAYRLKLIEQGSGFWGVELAGAPIHPVAAYDAFTTSRASLMSSITAIERLASAQPDPQYQYQIGAMQEEEAGQLGELAKAAAETKLRDLSRRRQIAEDRLAQIVQRQQQIAAERGPLESGMDHAGDALNAALLSAVTQSVGIPPQALSTIEGAAKGKIDKALEGAVLAYAQGSLGPELKSALGEFGDTALEAARTYQEVRDTAKRVEGGLKLLKAVERGETDAIIALGEEVLTTLDPETQQTLRDHLETARTIQTAAALAGDGTKLRHALGTFAARQAGLSPAVGAAVSDFLATGSADFDLNVGQALVQLTRHGAGRLEQAAAASLLGQGWSSSLVADVIPEADIEDAARALGGTCTGPQVCRVWLQDLVRTGGWTAHSAVSIDRGGLVTISSSAGELIVQFDLGEAAAQIAGRPLEDTVRTALGSAWSSARANAPRLTAALDAAVIDALPAERFDASLGRALMGAPENLKSAALAAANLSATGEAPPLDSALAGLVLGRELAERTTLKPEGGSSPSSGPSSSAAGGNAARPEVTDAMLQQALLAAGPYGIAASIALKAFQSFENLSDITDQLNALDKEDGKLIAETIHLTEATRNMELDEALSKLEYAVAVVKVGGASRRMERYRDALLYYAGRSDAVQRRIRDTLPLAYYQAEQMRFRLARLERAITFWGGGTGTGQGAIEAIIRSDPNSARLALDPEIRLFDWFGQTTPQRVDVGRLKTQWEQIGTIVDDVCQRMRCKRTYGRPGEVRNTDPVPLDALTGNLPLRDCNDGWYCASFTLRPDQFSFANITGLRLIDVAAFIPSPTIQNEYVSTTSLELMHSGLGFIKEGGVPKVERLAPSQWTNPKFVSRSPAEIQRYGADIDRRWTTQTLGRVEGYPLFGTYEARFPKSYVGPGQQIYFVFYYQVPEGQSDAPPLPEVAVRCGAEGSLEVPAEQVALLIAADPTGGTLTPTGTDTLGNCALVERPRP